MPAIVPAKSPPDAMPGVAPPGSERCAFCQHRVFGHDFYSSTVTGHVPCPECPDGMCVSSLSQE